MANLTLETIKESIEILPEEEQQNLFVWIEAKKNAPSPPHLTKLDRALMQAGLLPHPPTGLADVEAHENWKPVSIQGKPLSETIIEERR